MRTKKTTALLLAGVLAAGTLLGGCGESIKEDAVFATLDDTKITMGVANFCAKYQQATYDLNYMPYFGDDMWNSDLYGNGSTMQQDVKDSVVEDLEEMYLLKAHMEEYDISLTEEEEDAITKAADTFISENSRKALKRIGATDAENVKEMLRLNTIKNKMYQRIIEDADTAVTDEEVAQRTFSYVQIATDSHADEDNNTVEYTEDEVNQLKETAKKIKEAADFDAAVTEAGYTVSTHSYTKGDEEESMDEAVIAAADALKEGEISDVVETETAIYVLRLDSEFDQEATEKKKEETIKQKQDDYYMDILDGWKDKAKWTLNEKEWEKVTFDRNFTAIPAEDTESPEGTESPESTEN